MGTLQIVTTAQQDTRIRKAVGSRLRLTTGVAGVTRPATSEEVRQYIIKLLEQVVEEEEYRDDIRAVPKPPVLGPL